MGKASATRNRRSKPAQKGKPKASSKSRAAGRNGGRPATGFWKRKSIEELAAEQGIKPTRLEDILGKGAHLWESDEEFEKFVQGIYDRRRGDLALEKR